MTRRTTTTPTLAGLAWQHRGRYALGALCLLASTLALQSIPWLLRDAVDGLHRDHLLEPAVRTAGLMLLAALIGAGARIGSRLLLFEAARQVERDLRGRIFGHLLNQEPSYFQSMPVGEVMSRLTTDLVTVRLIFGVAMLTLCNAVLVYAIALTLMLQVDVRLTLYAALPLPLILLASSSLLRRLYARHLKVQALVGRVGETLQEDLAAVSVIKGYVKEEQRALHLASRSREHRDAVIGLARLRGALWSLLGLLSGVAGLVVLWLGALAVTHGRITLGQLVQFTGHLALIVWPTTFLGWAISVLQRGRAAWTRLQELLERPPRIQEPESPVSLERETVQGRIEVVGLRVERGDQTILEDVSFTILPQSATAIVGATSAGKTTVLEALTRFVDVAPGTVFVDGHDITTVRLLDLRRVYGYAPQDAWLFSDSLRKNVLWGLPLSENNGAVEERLASAVAWAGLEQDLAALPDGLETVVGERGVLLSGGQRQRVCLARALIGQPPVLLLDDALSAVDVQVERRILAALREQQSTLVLVSHRVTALADMDHIIVLDQGRVVEEGTHGELLRLDGRYARLYQEQRLAEALSAGEPPP